MKIETETETKTEPMAKRVALHPFLAGMNRTHLALLTDCAIAAHFEKAQTILRKGEFAKGFYLIESGEVVLESGEESGQPVVVDTIGPGDSLGLSWMFPPYVWRFTACAVEHIDAIFFPWNNVAGILRKGPLVRLRTAQADKPSYAQAVAGYPGQDALHPSGTRLTGDGEIVKTHSTKANSKTILADSIRRR